MTKLSASSSYTAAIDSFIRKAPSYVPRLLYTLKSDDASSPHDGPERALLHVSVPADGNAYGNDASS